MSQALLEDERNSGDETFFLAFFLFSFLFVGTHDYTTIRRLDETATRRHAAMRTVHCTRPGYYFDVLVCDRVIV